MATIDTSSLGRSVLQYDIEDLKTKKGKLSKSDIQKLTGKEAILANHLYANQEYLLGGSRKEDGYIDYNEVVDFIGHIDKNEDGAITESEISGWVKENVAVGGHSSSTQFGNNAKDIMQTIKTLFDSLAKTYTPAVIKKQETETKKVEAPEPKECPTEGTKTKKYVASDDCDETKTKIYVSAKGMQELTNQFEINMDDFLVMAEKVYKDANGSLDNFDLYQAATAFKYLDNDNSKTLNNEEYALYAAQNGLSTNMSTKKTAEQQDVQVYKEYSYIAGSGIAFNLSQFTAQEKIDYREKYGTDEGFNVSQAKKLFDLINTTKDKYIAADELSLYNSLQGWGQIDPSKTS